MERARQLKEYRAKRDFRSTPEPAPALEAAPALEPAPAPASESTAAAPESVPTPASRAGDVTPNTRGGRFVVHEHHARRLHWDLRLERDGALMSWAVPNGIPFDPSENRKAIHVEDHPLSYIDFEGEIPEGSYGAGRVSIWDRGRYDCEKLEDGKLIVVFHGQRLRGRYALFRTGGIRAKAGTRSRAGRGQDADADADKDWMIHRMDPPEHAREPMPERLTPMLASAGELPRDDAGWAYEIKWDGVRALAYWRPGRLRLESRKREDISARYPELRALGRQLGMREAVLDGEIVAFDEHGHPDFGRLQGRIHLTSQSAIRRLATAAPVTYAIFDLLHLDGRSTLALPYSERRQLLASLDLNGPTWQTPAYHSGDGRAFLAVSAEHGLEGVLAKRLDAPYRPGERGGEWLKVKNFNRQELVIGGWLEGKGRRADSFGALLVGYHEIVDGRRGLRYAGRVGTGFDERELSRLTRELAARKRRSSPFSAHGVQPPRDAHFVKPELVAEIAFSHWTHDRILRHSSYIGPRSDKDAGEVEAEPARAAPVRKAASGGRPVSAGTGKAASAGTGKAASAGTGRAESAGKHSRGEGTRARVYARATPRSQTNRSQTNDSPPPYTILRETKRHAEIEAGGRALRLSNRDKVMYPQTGFTKGRLIDYYAAVAPVLLGHLAGRPLTLKRYPDGVEEEYFYEKRCPAHRPDWVTTAAVWSERQSEAIDYCVVADLPTLIWAANLASIELHPSLACARDLDAPTSMVFDLDPGAPAGVRECARVALKIRELFDTFGLRTFTKTSGAKGLQVYVPLNSPSSYEQTKSFARAVAELLAREHPELALSRMDKRLRPGKVLIDWSQNDPHKTTVSVYSLRARERPTVSTPLSWEEVERASRWRRERELSLAPEALLARVARDGDLFAPLTELVQTLPDLASAPTRDREQR